MPANAVKAVYLFNSAGAIQIEAARLLRVKNKKEENGINYKKSAHLRGLGGFLYKLGKSRRKNGVGDFIFFLREACINKKLSGRFAHGFFASRRRAGVCAVATKTTFVELGIPRLTLYLKAPDFPSFRDDLKRYASAAVFFNETAARMAGGGA
jgi:hypothetical protein